MSPRETVAAATAAMMQGDVAGVVRHFALPIAIQKNGMHHVLGSEADLGAAIAALVQDLLERGVRAARGDVVHEMVEGDSAHLSVESRHVDGLGREMDQARTSYLLRRGSDGAWRIIVMTIDKACAYTRGACLLDEQAA